MTDHAHDRPRQPICRGRLLQATQRRCLARCRASPRAFPGVRALHDVSLSLYPGQVTALIGENGAGKSTLVKILTGIYQPDAGEISVDGEAGHPAERPRRLRARHHRHPPGNGAVRRSLRRRKHLPRPRAAHAFRHRSTGSTMRADAREVLDDHAAPAISIADARLRDLGIANKHLVAVARAMSIDAQIVIMDEPTAALSAQGDRGALPADRIPEERRQGDPVHQPQVRRDLPHRRPLHRVPRRRDGRRGADRRRQPERDRQA